MSNLQLRIGVLRGGLGPESEISLNSGSAVIHSIKDYLNHKYQVYDIFVDRLSNWYIDGVPISIGDLHYRVDIIFNALHGNYGEDGKVQSLLEWHGIPFTGTGSISSAIGMNKVMTKKHLDIIGINNPYGLLIDSTDIRKDLDSVVRKLFSSFILPGVIKPSTGGSSVGVSIVFDYTKLGEALLKASHYSDSVIIEEYINGIEATCGVIEDFRSEKLYALPPIEIRPNSSFFDYQSKYGGGAKEIIPATFSDKIKKEIESLSKKIHESLGLRHYSRSDFIIHPKRGIFVLEVNTLPGLTKESLFPKALRAIGSDLHYFIDHLIELAKR